MTSVEGIAVIGMSGRFPGARSVSEYWQNLKRGVESISELSAEELIASGVPGHLVESPSYVKKAPLLEDVDRFDAAFFGFAPQEAAILDPQHRLLLECAWEALEDAGYDGASYPGQVGVYAGVRFSDYLLQNLYRNSRVLDSIGHFQLLLSNDKDYLATQLSYRLDLTGPSMVVQTACSTALVAVHLACESLLHQECDLALAGASTIRLPQKAGYLAQGDNFFSADGSCRPFDAGASGTIFGSGGGVVVLKRLDEALDDGDQVLCVIRGSAVNNDGARKVGFTAPGADGQTAVIADALALAQVAPDSIGYVECNGTGTALGDPIEVAALTRAFRSAADATGHCAIGSVKSNFGHLEAAAGIAGLIKTVLALKHRQIPPSLHFEAPNPRIDFNDSPFFVATELMPWESNGAPLRAGVSSFGIGGTNAHVILEEAPAHEPSGGSRPWQLLLVSARTPSALDRSLERLATWLEASPEVELADAAYTLHLGRRGFDHRSMLVCRDREDAVRVLAERDPARLLARRCGATEQPVVFLLPGLGEHYVDMGLGLYQQEAVFRDEVDRCCRLLGPRLGVDLRQILYPRGTSTLEPRPPTPTRASWKLDARRFAELAVLVVELALARLWASWGIMPRAMLGHGLGEIAAAVLAGVFELEDALGLLTERARRIDQLPPGPLAFDASMTPPVAAPLVERIEKMPLRPPQIPFLSNVTGTWITAEEATDPAYWAAHPCRPARFAEGLAEILRDGERASAVLLEVGPGRGLGGLVLQQPPADAERRVVVPSLRPYADRQSDHAFALGALGQLWLAGVRVDWQGFWQGEKRHRLGLPTYPFERQRFWIDPDLRQAAEERGETRSDERHPAPTLHARPDLSTPYQAPRNELERTIAELWQEDLGIASIGVHDDYFDIGGRSLFAPRLLLRLEQALDVALPLETLLEHPTVAQLGDRIEQARRQAEAVLSETTTVDLAAEVTLDEEVRPVRPPSITEAAIDRAAAFLVSGGTGFLGAHLLRELFDQTEARLYCLARGGDAAAADDRLRHNLEHHQVWRPEMAERIEPLAGDLSRPRWGLSEQAFIELGRRVDAIYHAGAWVNFAYPYRVLEPSNVGATREGLRLAVTGTTKPFHFVSSTTVFPPRSVDSGPGLEDDPLPEPEGLFSGYAETKWVCERILGIARERGVPVAIYRPGAISGHSRTGAGNTGDIVGSILKGCIQLGAVMRPMPELDVVPVDYLARAIVHLSLRGSSLGKVFQFANPSPMPWEEVFDIAEGMGYALRRLSYPEWRRELGEAASAGGDNALIPFLPLFPEVRAGGDGEPVARDGGRKVANVRYDDRNTREGLSGSPVKCPTLDAGLVRTYLDFFIADGFLDPPPRS